MKIDYYGINRVGHIIISLDDNDGWYTKRIILSRKEAKILRRVLKEALRDGKT